MTFERPLEGKTVVVTRPREQASSLLEPLQHLGAEILLAPTIRIVPRPFDDEARAAVAALPEYGLVVFTSANGARVFFDHLAQAGASPGAALAGAVVAAVGPVTAAALEGRGVVCDVVPDDFVAEGLVAALDERGLAPSGLRALIPAARDARAVLPDALRARGVLVDALTVYDTEPAASLDVAPARIEGADFITFTSSSTARQFVALLEGAKAAGDDGRTLAERLAAAALCSIGPVTSETLRELGLPVAVQALESTAAGLVAAIAASARGLA
jgi:uroporphyrinogen III methyltransferase/synthase